MAALTVLTALSETWTEAHIAGTEDANLIDNYMQQHQRATRERFSVDHVAYADESGHDNIGAHNIVHLLVQTSIQSLVNGGCLYTKDADGVAELYFKDESENEIQITDSGKIKYTSVDGVANDTYITAKNAAGDGTVDLIKANASDVAVIPDGSQMASDAAPTEDAGIANKKYVDDQIAAIPSAVALGDWVSKVGSYGTQQATTDGFVVFCFSSGTNDRADVYTDSNSSPSTIRVQALCPNGGGAANGCFPVKKSDYWKITLTGGTMNYAYWIPLS